jgi:hypothetical protein
MDVALKPKWLSPSFLPSPAKIGPFPLNTVKHSVRNSEETSEIWSLLGPFDGLQNLHPRFKSGRRLQPSLAVHAKVARRSLGEGGLPRIASELRLASQFFQQAADTPIA